MNKNEIILFETSDHTVKMNVNTDGETVWLNRTQLAELFDRDISVIGRHINALFKEKELEKESNVQNMHIPNSDKSVEFYYLDVIMNYMVNCEYLLLRIRFWYGVFLFTFEQ